MEKITRFLELIEKSGYNVAKYRILTRTGSDVEIIEKIHSRILKQNDNEEIKKIFLNCFKTKR